MKTMTKRILWGLPLFCLLAALILCLPAHAAPSASLRGNGTLRAGDVLTLTLRVSGDGLLAVQGEMTYNSSKLTYLGASTSLSGWTADLTESSGALEFLVSDDALSAPIRKESNLLTIRFRVSGNLSVGTSLRVDVEWLSATDGESDFEFTSNSYQATIAAPLSSDATLSALSVAQTSLTPAFAPDITEYTAATVPFAVESLTLEYTTSDGGATVEVTGNELVVGDNVIILTVTAENGNEKVYRISLEREQDPNYIPASDSALSGITLSSGLLSPAFAPDTHDYLVVLPYEITELTASGTPRDPLAIGCKEERITLGVGENLLTLLCRAEDGSGTSYLLHIIRMPAYEGLLPTVTPGTEPPRTEPPQVTSPPDSLPEQSSTSDAPTEPIASDDPAQSTPEEPKPSTTLERLTDRSVLTALIATAAVMLGIGLVIGALAARPKKRKYRRKTNKR